jgi:DNA primase
VPFLGFRVERVLGAASMATPEARARAAEDALEVIREHPSDLVRDQYVMEVASRTRLAPEQLRSLLAAPPRTAARPARGEPERGRAVAVDRGPRPTRSARAVTARESAELEALRLLIIDADAIGKLLHPVLFDDDRALAAYAALTGAASFRDAVEAADEPTADLLVALATQDSDAEVGDVVDLLIMAAAGRELDEFKTRASLDDPTAFADLAADTNWVKLRLEELREDTTRTTAREQLLAWLTQEPEERG